MLHSPAGPPELGLRVKGPRSKEETEQIYRDLPLLSPSKAGWAKRAAGRLDIFLADHAVCEQQAALTALNLVAHYPEDDELVERMTALAAEEVTHLRRVTTLMRGRGLRLMRRRPNPYVRGLRERVRPQAEPRLKIDRLVVGALIEARSCERFTRLLEVIGTQDAEVADLLADLGPAERRHWVMFHRLAAREAEPAWFETHWREWLEYEDRLIAERGDSPRVHG
jgi:tRNA-(ms[2]io[6]A)-hydroxylase